MAAPEPIPRNGDNSLLSYTWGETPDTAVQPSAGRKDTGWLPGDTVTQGEMNWLDQTPAKFARAYFAENMRASSGLVGSWLHPGTAVPIEGLGTWSETGVGNPLEGFLSDATGIPSRAVDVWIDPDANGAQGLQVKVTLASPNLFIAISDNYVFVDTTAAEAGLGGGLTFVAVPNGNPAPPTPANTVLVWIVVTDASNITGQSIELPTFPVMKTVAFEFFAAGAGQIAGDLEISGTLTTKTTEVPSGGSITMFDSSFITIEGDTGNGGSALIADAGSAVLLQTSVTLGVDETTAGTFNLNCTLGNTNAYTHILNGSVTIGTDPTNSHTVNGDLVVGATSAESFSINSTVDTVILASLGVTGATGGNPVDLIEGANIPTTKIVTFVDSTLTSDLTGDITWNGPATFNGQATFPSRLTITATVGAGQGDMSVSGDNLRFRDSGGNEFIHKNTSGWFKGHGQADSDTGANVQIDTQAVAPLTSSDVDIVASAWIQRDGADDVTVSILEVGGAGQLGVSQDISVPDDVANDYQPVTFSRTRVAADTTPRVYRFFIDGNGANVICKALHITATPAA